MSPDFVEAVGTWLAEGRRVAVATVIETWGSSPRPVGSMLAVGEDGRFVGSVSGGCVEGAVVDEALRRLRNGGPKILEFAELDPQRVWDVGLSCGGRIRVLVEAIEPSREWTEAMSRARARRPFLFVAELQGGRLTRYIADEAQTVPARPWKERALEALSERKSRTVELDEATVFLQFVRRPERMVIVGGVHVAIPLIGLANRLGFETILIEPRTAFASSDRFPEPPSHILCEHPVRALEEIGVDEDTFAVLLTHDPKVDDPALRALLRSRAAYIGALGSRTTQARRKARLAEEGYTPSELARIRGPVGLDIGASTPEEIALSIVAEAVQVRRGATARAPS